MAVLFSPIGTADPLTQLGDGPMLHIVRHYNPEKVVLFLTQKMAEHQHACALYTKAIELLSESLERETPQIEIIESSFDGVYKFDEYIDEFENALKTISCDKEPILVNTSSGTPAMAQALVALGSFGRLNLEMLQVTTPRKDANHAYDREPSSDWNLEHLSLLWELNPDNENQAPVRIVQVKTPNFSEQLLRENVTTLIKTYEYEAASILCKSASGISERGAELIRAAADRLNLDGQLPAKVFGGTSLRFSPNDLLPEYLYIMEVRLEQGHWADFIRSMSPALTEIMKRELASCVRESSYNLYKNGCPTGRYNIEGIHQDEKLSKLFPDTLIATKDQKGETTGKYITNDSYWQLIKAYCDNNDCIEKIQKLREAERNGRNALAHEIKSSPKKSLEKECGMTLERIMQFLFELCSNAKPGMYKRINAEILKRMQE